MTTIAYRGGVLAADSQINSCDARMGSLCKVRQFSNGALLGVAGGLMTIVQLFELVEEREGYLDPGLCRDMRGISGLYVEPDGTVWSLEGGPKGGMAQMDGRVFAEGSGAGYALAAMKAGASAVRAVEIAAEIDMRTGGPVRWVRLPRNWRET
jgi:ATP-dependent protease HslVU (ClpYQ) peptidase subunit